MLVKSSSPWGGNDAKQYVNYGHDDQMEICGYKSSRVRTAATYLSCLLTLGLLRLFFHWYPRYLLKCTHIRCGLDVADKVLVTDIYKDKYRTFYVEKVRTLRASEVAPQNNNPPNEPSLLTFNLTDAKTREATTLRTFCCKRVTFIWDTSKHAFIKLCGLENGLPQSELHAFEGLDEHEQLLRRAVYGPNEIDVPLQSIFKLFILEALTPFYIFQVYSLVVWMFESYYYYGIAIVIMSVTGISFSVIQARKNQTNLRGTVHLTDNVEVQRGNGSCVQVATSTLVPGDVIIVPSHGCIMHCDAVLLNGSCIVNESMLTGESVPVVKTSLPNAEKPFNLKDDTNHVLFCGTKVIQTRVHGDERVRAVVIRTGFLTTKGQLVRSIMYPPPVDFKFDQDSYKFMGILAVIAAFGVVYTVVSKSSRHISIGDIIIKSLTTITIVIPPALPAAMTVGKLYALGRLKKNNVFCMNSRVINVSGSINCICFDKTGTLTEDGLDMWGVVPVDNGKLRVPERDPSQLPAASQLLQGMATCHSLAIIDGKPDGDPLDVKMFQSTGWMLEEPRGVSTIAKFGRQVHAIVHSSTKETEIALVHQHQFSSNLQRMSVVVQRLNSPTLEVFCKGAPEMIASLCDPNTVPLDISSEIKRYTERGFRVIAMAHRELSNIELSSVHKRDLMEHDLTFLGLIVLENKLKKETTGIIKVLKQANMKIVMITGDNIQTALSVAKECGILEKGVGVIDVEAKAPTKTEDAKLIYNLIEEQATTDYSTTDCLNMETGPTETRRFQFAMTGLTWATIKEYFPLDLPKLVTRGTVFARMSSDQKQQLIEELQGLGYYVAMCGDGTNDCGALKAAHAGISLSEAESSVASPFTSRTPNISCVPEVIKQGRAALATSFGLFKFMITYSLTQFTSVMILYGIDCNLTNFEFLFIDICLVVVFASLFGKTEAYEKKLHNRPPMTSLLSMVPLASLTLHMLCVITFQALSYNIIQTFDWFTPFKFILDTQIFNSYENYAVFTISTFQYITMAVIFSTGPPYRKPVYTNKFFTAVLILGTIVCAYITLEPTQWVSNTLELMIPPSYNGKVLILILAGVHFTLAYILEDFLVGFILQKKIKPRFHNVDTSRKRYLRVEREFSIDSRWKFISRGGGQDNVAYESEQTVTKC